MLNIDVAVNSFWQFARFWRNGETAKFEMSCENGTIEMNISSKLGHPDLLHFPPPPPPPPTIPPPPFKRKNASQLQRKERRQQTQAQENIDDDLETLEEPDIESEANVTHVKICSSSTSPPHTLPPLLPRIHLPLQGQPFSSPSHLPTSTPSLLSNQTSFECTKCVDIFQNEEALQTHMMINHTTPVNMNKLDYLRVFKCEACYFESSNINEIEAHIKIHIPLHISLLKPPLRKQDFGAFAHPPFESTFTQCL